MLLPPILRLFNSSLSATLRGEFLCSRFSTALFTEFSQDCLSQTVEFFFCEPFFKGHKNFCYLVLLFRHISSMAQVNGLQCVLKD